MPTNFRGLIFVIFLAVFGAGLRFLMPEHWVWGTVLTLFGLVGMLWAAQPILPLELIGRWREAVRLSFWRIAIAVVFVVIVVGLGWWFRRDKGDFTFAVDVRSGVTLGDGPDASPLTKFMVGYTTMFGATASPIYYLAYLQITNLQDVVRTVKELKIAASEEADGPWEELVQIPLDSVDLYSVGPVPPAPCAKRWGLKNGMYDMSGPETKEELKNAAQIKAEQVLRTELRKTMQPHASVSGWVALDFLKHVGLLPKKVYFRVTILDTTDRGGDHVVRMPRGQEGASSMEVNNGSLLITGAYTDISGSHIKYYGDPFPHPK